MANHERLDPAATVVDILGQKVVSEITGLDRTQIWRWTQPRDRNGTNGFVPNEHQLPLLEYAEKHKKPLTADIIIRGAKSADYRAGVPAQPERAE